MSAALLVAVGVSAAAMPQVDGVAPLMSGRATINLAPAEYEIRAGAGTLKSLDDAARAAGWRPATTGVIVLPTSRGAVDLHAYTAGTAWLLQGRTDGPEPVTVRARLEQAPVWTDATGEAPGREPGDAPRPSAGRRLLHVAGDGFEAACYRSPGSPAAVLRDAARRLAWRKWNVAPLGDAGLLAARPGSPDLAWHVRSDGTGSLVLVLASERAG